MINTTFFRRWRAPEGQLRRSHAAGGGAALTRVPRGLFAAQEGVSLIEVMVSALMVGFIVIATFTGFNNVNHTTADERAHDQAALLAAQSQEALRSDSADTLDAIQYPASHVYTQTLGGETYTITQSDQWISDANQNASCSATGKEHSSQAGNYLRISTAVTWPQLSAAKRKPLEQYSIITPPDGSGLEVDVLNGRIPEQPVTGATVIAGEAEATTGEAGCVIFGGIPATRINIETFKAGDVTPTGAIKKVVPEALIAPNVTTQEPVVLNKGAMITAEFTHEGKPATGDTFVASNSKISVAPDFEVGSTRFGTFASGTGEYEALPGEAKVESYKATATTPVSSTYYSTGNLFPFESAWFVYAGDCTANNPHTVDESQFSESSISSPNLEPGQDATVKIPTSYVLLNAYSGTKASHPSAESALRPVKITNTGCSSSPTPNNASAFKTVHTQETTTTGHLEAPYQPFGESFKLCLYDQTTKYKFTTTYASKTIAGSTINLYLKETSNYTEEAGHTIEVSSALSNTC